MNAGRADAVITLGRDDAGDHRAVPVLVNDRSAAGDPVPAVQVVQQPIAVVIAAIATFRTIRPLVVPQVRVCEINAAVNDGDDSGLSARGRLPGRHGLNVRIGLAAGRARVPQGPLLWKARVVRRHLVARDEVVRLGELYERALRAQSEQGAREHQTYFRL